MSSRISLQHPGGRYRRRTRGKKILGPWREEIGELASSFPGLFTLKELLALDARERNFWLKVARKNELKRELADITAMRLSFAAEGESIRRRVLQIEFALARMRED